MMARLVMPLDGAIDHQTMTISPVTVVTTAYAGGTNAKLGSGENDWVVGRSRRCGVRRHCQEAGRKVIEKRMFSQVEDLLPVISFGSKKDGEAEKKHGEFVERMAARGYTERQVRRLVDWYLRVK
jgi:PrkA serine protein kinase C-terminal domain